MKCALSWKMKQRVNVSVFLFLIKFSSYKKGVSCNQRVQLCGSAAGAHRKRRNNVVGSAKQNHV